MVGASSLEGVLSWPLEVVVVVELPFLAWVEGVLSWPLEVAGVVVEVGSSPWLTPHANTESL
jgi:hypothetical protein